MIGRALTVPPCAAILALASSLGFVGCSDGDGAGNGSAPSASVVRMQEYEFVPRRLSVRQGETIQVVNDGEIAHNLTIEGEPGGDGSTDPLAGTASFLPGRSVPLTFDLPAGRTYTMVCTVPGHRELGMTGRVRVEQSR